jgi:phenylalanyl-tRNA synthetase alpha chain
MENIYKSEHLKRSEYAVPLEEQRTLLEKLKSRGDTEAKRLQEYLALPDLTRLDGNPTKAVTDRVINLPTFQGFDVIKTPDVIPSEIVFDLFNFPKDHPARSRSDTYYVDEKHILRPHMSMMWKYYFDIPEVQQKLKDNGSVGAISYGTVYRRDEIDWQHTNVLHHIDGLFVCRKDIKEVGQSDLEDILWDVARVLFGKGIVGRFNVEHYPYTDPSLEMEIAWNDKWVEILGAGIVHPQVLRNLGIDPDVYSGWAFGFGADRLAMIKMKIPDIRLLRSTDERVLKQFKDIDHVYQPVSKYPPIVRDISFIVDKEFNLNRYYEIVREIIGDEYIEEVKLLDKFENEERFGKDNTSYTFRITYRHLDRTLTNAEVDELHKKLETRTVSEFSARIR